MEVLDLEKLFGALVEKMTHTKGWIYYFIGSLLLLNVTNYFLPLSQYLQTIISAISSKAIVSAIHIVVNCLLVLFIITGTIVILGIFVYEAMEKLGERDIWHRHNSIDKIEDFAFYTVLKTQYLCLDTYEYLLIFVLTYFLVNKVNYTTLINQLFQIAQGHILISWICAFWALLCTIETFYTLYKKFFYATKISDTKE